MALQAAITAALAATVLAAGCPPHPDTNVPKINGERRGDSNQTTPNRSVRAVLALYAVLEPALHRDHPTLTVTIQPSHSPQSTSRCTRTVGHMLLGP